MVATITGGTIVWFVLFVIQLPFYGTLRDGGHLWWLWTCLAGGGLGLVGVWYVRRRDAAIKRHEAARAAEREH
ncbi:membrane protein [Streptomyces caatingaensis]|uniref:Membrane protein n=1 Tax=Streptomyces caatingaensis TaxID=1678637 RepID=A0A0K9XE59_9ACTN|nr:membrane protein [Streptomyces caatingaensis]